VAVAEGSDAQQAHAALLALEFRTLAVTAERRYSPTVMTPSPVPGAAVTQFAVLDALLARAYEPGLRVAEARSIGDSGSAALTTSAVRSSS
jgi:hypothetical protein